MIISCSCGNFQSFNRKDDTKDYEKAGWKIAGFNIKENSPYYFCPKCVQKNIPIKKREVMNGININIDAEEESLYIET